MTSRARAWCFTINNWTSKDLEEFASTTYQIRGKEVGGMGTPHLQGYVYFAEKKSLKQMKKLHSTAHWEAAKGTPLEASDYCKKDGDFVESGELPLSNAAKGTNEVKRWDEIRIAAEEGRVEDIPDDIRFHNIRLIEYHHRQAQKKRKLDDTEETNLWYYGKTRTGKSRKARTENPDAYLKMCNKWWDDYDGQHTVLIEDFDRKHDVLCHHLKIWSDRYPFPAEIKGSKIDIRPKRVIVTSNYHPNEIWNDESDLDPILARFKIVHFLPNL